MDPSITNRIPDFIIVGERRSGTTFLYNLLKMHHQVSMPDVADFPFFIDDYIIESRKNNILPVNDSWERQHSLQEYASHFSGSSKASKVGYKCADYLFWTPAHQRIKRYHGTGRFLVSLRNPIKRAWSHYWNEVGKGRESRSFEHAIIADTHGSSETDYEQFHLSYVERGFYARSLKEFFITIPRDNVLVIILEELLSNSQAVFDQICDFVGVARTPFPKVPKDLRNAESTMIKKDWVSRNSIFSVIDDLYVRCVEKLLIPHSATASKKRALRTRFFKPLRKQAVNETMGEEIYHSLLQIYQRDITELEQIIEKDLTSWKRL